MSRKYKPIKNLESKLHVGTVATYVLFCCLMALFVYWNVARSSDFSLVVFAIQAGPLLLLLPSMIKRYYRAYSWLCFILLFYFIIAVERAFVSTAGINEYLFVGLIVSLFISAMMTGRWLQRTQKQEMMESNDLIKE